jgi:hypothetical protein
MTMADCPKAQAAMQAAVKASDKTGPFVPASEIKKGLVDDTAPDTRTTTENPPYKPDKADNNKIPPSSGFVSSFVPVDECVLTVKTPPNVANIPPTFPPEIEVLIKRGLQFGIYDRIKGGYARDYQDSILKAIEFWVAHVAEVEE